MPDLILYHTEGCHLCELAAEILNDMQIDFIHQDICDDEQLVAGYGTRIPVLVSASGQELNWPFDTLAVKQFLGA